MPGTTPGAEDAVLDDARPACTQDLAGQSSDRSAVPVSGPMERVRMAIIGAPGDRSPGKKGSPKRGLRASVIDLALLSWPLSRKDLAGQTDWP